MLRFLNINTEVSVIAENNAVIANKGNSGTVGFGVGLSVGMGDAVGFAVVEGVGVLAGYTVNPVSQSPAIYNIE